MPYAILRTAKLSSFGSLAGSASHNYRQRETPNAERTVANESFGAQSIEDLEAAVKARLDTVPKVRSNAVLAVEYFIGASPEFFKDKDRQGTEAFFADARKWLDVRHGAQNVVGFTIHHDETTPHACAYVVPIDERGKLNARQFLGGRAALSAMQSDFADRVGARHGLQRGIERSGARHTTVKEFYARIQAPTPAEIPVPELPQKGLLDRLRPEAYHEAVRQHEAAVAHNHARAKAIHAKATQHDIDSQAKTARAAELNKMQDRARHVREIPLRSVLEWMDCKPEAQDKQVFHTPASRITLKEGDEQKFFNRDLNKGGGGAIDLVMQLHGVDYKTAVGELAQKFGTDAVAADLMAGAKKFAREAIAEVRDKPRLPEPAPEKWLEVRHYLISAKHLSERLVDWLHETQKLFADRFGNACFVLVQNAGVEQHGAVNGSTYYGVRGRDRAFHLAARKGSAEKRIAVVASAIEACSLRSLGFTGQIASSTGHPSNRLLEYLKAQ